MFQPHRLATAYRYAMSHPMVIIGVILFCGLRLRVWRFPFSVAGAVLNDKMGQVQGHDPKNK